MIRPARKSDLPGVRRLWELCFPDEGGFNAYYFSHFFSLQHLLVLTEADRLCAMVQMLPYRLRIGGQQAEATYIYGACTDPAERRRGCMARLLERSFALDREAGRRASMLIPQEEWLFSFYQAFGYQPFFLLDKKTLRRTKGGVLPRRLSQDDIPQLRALYDGLSVPCLTMRDEVYWQGQLALFNTLGAGAFGWFEGEKLVSYAFCWLDAAQEAIGLTEDFAQGLMQVLDRETLEYSTVGSSEALGCIKWYGEARCGRGYMNLMLN